ncbi:MAG: (deoxy)nucleoside triphosphate pyrophosphohydrolase, partial [archaeon]|nr:(deoxy)nucleoside triphosphate pyrophosphohydrolase [archaeon]
KVSYKIIMAMIMLGNAKRLGIGGPSFLLIRSAEESLCKIEDNGENIAENIARIRYRFSTEDYSKIIREEKEYSKIRNNITHNAKIFDKYEKYIACYKNTTEIINNYYILISKEFFEDDIRLFLSKIKPAVSTAIIISKEKILCMQNGLKKYDYLTDHFEFPGGKIEERESPKDTIIREISEELHTDISGYRIEEYMIVTHAYPDFTVTLHNFLIYTDDFEFELTEHQSFRWCSPSELNSLNWAAADKVVVDHLLEDLSAGRIKTA